MSDAECLPQVERAHQIDWLLNDKAGTQDLDDSEIVDAADADEEEGNSDGDDGDDDDGDEPISISSDGEEDILKKASCRKSVTVKSETHTPSLNPIACCAASNRLDTPFTCNTRTPRNAPADLLNSISRSLDPSLSAARDEDRAAWSLQTTQFLSLSNQLCDAQAASNDLRNRLLQADRDHSDAERHADRAELQLEMERMCMGSSVSMRSPLYSRHSRGH
jgi:hypothetical protein